MRATLFFAPLLCLAGCNYAPSTSITTTTINGTDVLHSVITTTDAGGVKFECSESASGTCNYAVFADDCSTAAKDVSTTTCTFRVIDRFTLARGESKNLAGLPPGFRYCVNQDRQPAVPGCTDRS